MPKMPRVDLGLYTLIGRLPVPCRDVLEWGRWLQGASRHVASTKRGGVHVSTVFLGINHSFRDGDDPDLFETMIFGGEFNDYQTRCATWDEAEEMHRHAEHLVWGKLKADVDAD